MEMANDLSIRSGLEIRDLTKRYRSGALANAAIDLHVERGEVFGLLGPNGAGKTTLVKQLIGLLSPTSGSIHLDGVDLVAFPDQARRLCAYLPQGALPIDALEMTEAIELVGRIRGGSRDDVIRRANSLIEDLEIGEWRHTPGHRLSGGVKRLCGFVMAAVWPSRLLILDEPTNDVDPLRRRLLWREIRRLGDAGTTILLVTHNVLEAEQSVDRLAVIDQGVIKACGTSAELKAPSRDSLRLELHLALGGDAKTRVLDSVPHFVADVATLGHRRHVFVSQEAAAEAIRWAQELSASGAIEEYSLSASSLEDVYLAIIGRSDALDGAAGGESS